MSDQAMTATVDLDVCKGHGRCYMLAPDIFDCDDAGFPVVIGEANDDTQRALIVKAASNCPEQAITVV
ncbi:ferredoxin [Nocardioides ultimimeridianus]